MKTSQESFLETNHEVWEIFNFLKVSRENCTHNVIEAFLKKEPNAFYLSSFIQLYPDIAENYKMPELFEEADPCAEEIVRLMISYKPAKNKRLLEMCLSKNPSARVLGVLLVIYEEARTVDAVNLFLSKTHDPQILGWVIREGGKFFQNETMLRLFVSLKPTAFQIALVLRDCPFAHIPELYELFYSLNPSEH